MTLLLKRVLVCLCLTAFAFTGWSADTRPNIVIIMADDLGFSDVGCFGGEIRTPNIDSLAQNGLRFTQFYNAARCCPTRASLLTGQYAHKVGLARNGNSLTRNGATIAELLKVNGYQTGLSGKWHLSFTPVLPEKHQMWLDHRFDAQQPFAPLDSYPVNRGFDRNFGIVWGVINYFDPFSLVDGTNAVKEVPKDFYITDAITDHAVSYVQDFAKADKPFFLYVAHCAPHWPLHALPEDIAKYRDTYKDGWHELRKKRFEKQKQLGLFDPKNTTLPPVQGNGKDWDALTPEEKNYQAAKMAVHAAMVDRLDQGVGKLIEALRAAKQLDNTVIFFMADNGASPEIPNVPGYDRNAFTRTGEKIRYEQEGIPVESLGKEMSYTGIGSYWANAANTPFRFWKKESYEGGAHTPMIVHWPKGLKAKGGSMTETVGHVIDLLPTCLDLAKGTYPAEYKGNKLTALDGLSLMPVLQGKQRTTREAVFFEHENGRAVRMGDWKLVGHSRPQSQWELYNLKEDRTEMRNLATANEAQFKLLKERYDEWFRAVAEPMMPGAVKGKKGRE
ncbi:MAG: atsA 17 [Verrucomicrobia bacterium]|jgi:arylsulfatase|nr:atsA 17 [Verrucomicrobiota bacterium]